MNLDIFDPDDLRTYFVDTIVLLNSNDSPYYVNSLNYNGDEDGGELYAEISNGHSGLDVPMSDISPWWPESGYYNARIADTNCAIYLEGCAKQHHKKSYSKRTYSCSISNPIDASLLYSGFDRQDAARIYSKWFHNPVYPSWNECLELLGDNATLSVSPCRSFGVYKFFYMKYPVVTYQKLPVGYVADEVVRLMGEFDYLYELFVQYAPTEIEYD